MKRLSRRTRLAILITVATLYAGSAAPAAASVCTLADQIRSANTNTAVGFCPAGTSHDIIAITEDITLSEPLPAITGTITIEGGGHTISGDNKFRIFEVIRGNLTINNLTLTEGKSVLDMSGPGGSGGAIEISGGARVTVNDSVFARNYSGVFGGAIAVFHSTLVVNNSSFIRNHATAGGGAINLWYGTGDIRNSSFVYNSAGSYEVGGAIRVSEGAKLEASNSSFNGNSADRGGAVASEVRSPAGRVVPSATTLTHVTIMKNYAKTAGSGISIGAYDKNFNLRNSIIAGTPIRADAPAGLCVGPLNENLGNLIADGSCGSMPGGDPMVADMTGAPAHFPLLDGSPALDAADARYCLETDQTGAPRPIGVGCDIGAIESTTAKAIPTPMPGVCPLPDQIIAANSDTAVGNCPAGHGADTIHLIRDFTLSAKLPPITSEISIEGNGYTISGDNRFGIFEVDGGALTMRNLTLTEGSGSKGGAILLQNGGAAAVENVTFLMNTAFFGGAIATESVNDRLSVSNSSFLLNSAKIYGGAIMTEGGSVSISGSAFVDNWAQQYGGAIASASGRTAIANSTLSRNKAQKGGGIYVEGGETTLTHLTLMNNMAERIVGAGIYREAGAVHLRNSIIASGGSGDDCSGPLDQNRGNFSQDGSCAARAGGDPELLHLVGSPAHHPLLDGSPAHGAADPAFCLPSDQLGNARTHCDIGAIESARAPDYQATPRTGLPADCTLADQIIAANTDAPVGSCPAGDGADVITLRRSIRLSAPLPSIHGDLVIDGGGHTISGNSLFRIFNIEEGKVVFKQMTLANGSNPEGDGGAITVGKVASLTVSTVTFRGNKARRGGAIAATGNSSLKVFDSSFLDNAAASQGGAIWSAGNYGCVDNSAFRRNAGIVTNALMADTQSHIYGDFSQCGVVANSFSDT